MCSIVYCLSCVSCCVVCLYYDCVGNASLETNQIQIKSKSKSNHRRERENDNRAFSSSVCPRSVLLSFDTYLLLSGFFTQRNSIHLLSRYSICLLLIYSIMIATVLSIFLSISFLSLSRSLDVYILHLYIIIHIHYIMSVLGTSCVI